MSANSVWNCFVLLRISSSVKIAVFSSKAITLSASLPNCLISLLLPSRIFDKNPISFAPLAKKLFGLQQYILSFIVRKLYLFTHL